MVGVIAGILLGVLSNWLYDILRSHNQLPDRPSLKRGLVVLLTSAPLVVLAVAATLTDDHEHSPLTLDDLQRATPPSSGVAAPTGGFGPSRPILDWDNEADRIGFTDGPHFNSYINTNIYGDERAFLDAKSTAIRTPGQFKDELRDVGGRYYIRAYIENGGLLGQEHLKTMTARNTRIQFEWRPGSANGFTIQARITADNAIPREIYDVVELFNDSRRFGISLVHGSAKLYNRHHPTGIALGDEIVGDGVLIGTSHMDGIFLPGYEESAFVVIEVVAS